MILQVILFFGVLLFATWVVTLLVDCFVDWTTRGKEGEGRKE